MPKLDGKEYSYDEKGMKAFAKAKKKKQAIQKLKAKRKKRARYSGSLNVPSTPPVSP